MYGYSVIFLLILVYGICGDSLESVSKNNMNLGTVKIRNIEIENEIPSDTIKQLAKCSSEGGFTGIVNCAAFRVLRSIERMEKEKFLEIVPGITLISNTSIRYPKQLKPDLPSDPFKKASKLYDLLLNTASRFISDRTVTIKLPQTTPEKLARALEEGRGKMKKMMGPLLLGLGSKMMSMIPITFGFLTLLTTKALLVGKLAFVISLVLFIQMFFNGRSILPFVPFGGSTSYGIPTTYGTNFATNNLGGWSSQYPYARSIDNVGELQENTQDYAYSAHKS